MFAVAPHHPLAAVKAPIDDAELIRHRAVAVADSAQRMTPITVNLLPGQDVFTVSDMQAKIEALLRGIGCGFVPEPMVRGHIATGALLVKQVQRRRGMGALGYAWRAPSGGAANVRKPRPGSPCAGGWSVWSGRRRGAPCSSATASAEPRPGHAAPTQPPRWLHPTSAASRPRRPACCTPARWSPRWPPGSTRAPTPGAG